MAKWIDRIALSIQSLGVEVLIAKDRAFGCGQEKPFRQQIREILRVPLVQCVEQSDGHSNIRQPHLEGGLPRFANRVLEVGHHDHRTRRNKDTGNQCIKGPSPMRISPKHPDINLPPL